MGDDLGTLNEEQLTRLAQYFDEAVTYPHKYKRLRGALPRQALRGPRVKTPRPRQKALRECNLAPLVSERTQAAIMAIEKGLISISL